jgi:hypothetical protein
MINLTTADVLGSIQKMELVLHSDLESFNPVVLDAGISWDEVELLPDNAKLRFAVDDTENGKLFNYAVAIKHTLLRPAVEDVLDKYVGKRAVVRVMDMNDRVYIIGHPGNGCILNYSGDTGNNAADQNAYDISVIVSQTFRAPSA